VSHRRGVTIVKLGGSLALSPELRGWLAALVRGGAGRVAVVPGGGPFADAVRTAQREQGFDDASAHRMALLAMEQYALMLMGMQAQLALADSSAAFGRELAQARVPVWMPSTMVLASREIPASWDVTSDSLAAWLARELGAGLLVLVKSVRMTQTQATAAQLVSRGWVDPLFARFAAAAGCQIRLLGRGDQPRLTRMLASGAAEGLEVLVST
jgi:5-(aminomethyl)-3-furanmethanol phosphate kinase